MSLSTRLSRRQVLRGIGTAAGVAALGCKAGLVPGDDDDGAVLPEGDAAIGDPDAGGVDGSPGAQELLAGIETVVVLCMENRSFDHYFGSMLFHEGKAVDGLTGTEGNPDSNGLAVPIFHLTDLTPDSPPHSWDAAHAQWNGGANDGFVKAHAGSSEKQVMGYYLRDELPIHYALADSFVVCDRWFSSVMGPTWPNRFYLHAATSKGTKSNVPAPGITSTIWDRLDAAGISNQNYYHDLPWCAGGYFKFSGISGIENFFDAAAKGSLPAFALIDPEFFFSGQNDDRPPANIMLGQALIATVFAALAKSPQWNRCLFVLTYDEHGGFFDHVSPSITVDDEPGFAQLGFRVPSLVCGPFVKKGQVVSTQFDHVSIASTLTTRFGLEPLNARVSATNDLSSCIDPAFLANPQPAPSLPTITLPTSRLRTLSPPVLGHRAMWEAAESGAIPRHLDRRRDAERISAYVLRQGERLGALSLRD